MNSSEVTSESQVEAAEESKSGARPSLAKRCFFKNAVVYRLPKDFNPSSAELEEILAKFPLTELGAIETERRGFVASTPVSDRIVHTVNGTQHLIAMGTYTKILPGAVVRQETEKRAREIAEEQGFPVGRKQMRELKDKVKTELLAKALVKTQVTRAWIDTANGWLVVEAAGASRAEKLVTALRDAMGSFPATLVDPQQSPQNAMASWLRVGDAPRRFSLDSDLEMRSLDKDHATVRYVRHALDGEDIKVHLDSGKAVTRLGLTWADRISFVLTNKFEIKKIDFVTLDAEQNEEGAEVSVEEQYDADVIIMTSDLAALLNELVESLGGLEQAGE